MFNNQSFLQLRSPERQHLQGAGLVQKSLRAVDVDQRKRVGEFSPVLFWVKHQIPEVFSDFPQNQKNQKIPGLGSQEAANEEPMSSVHSGGWRGGRSLGDTNSILLVIKCEGKHPGLTNKIAGTGLPLP